MPILFIHGLESGPHGKKARYLQSIFECVVPHMKHPYVIPWSVYEVYRQLQEVKKKSDLKLIVASSYGCIICTLLIWMRVIDCHVIMLAPPFPHFLQYFWTMSETQTITIVQGLRDELFHVGSFFKITSEKYLKKFVVNDTHDLNRTMIAENGLHKMIISIINSLP